MRHRSQDRNEWQEMCNFGGVENEESTNVYIG